MQVAHGLADSLAQFEAYEQHYRGFSRVAAEFFDDLVSHYVLDDGRLVVAHAGLKESLQGRGSGAVREFCMYGETTGETDEFGLPVRYPWAADYRGAAMVVYGHTPVPNAEWLNRTLNIDTGCVFGGKLTALRYPEKGIVSVPARATYAEPRRPFLPETPALSAQHAHDDLLDLADLIGKRIIGKVHEPLRIRGETAHHLQRSGRVFLADGDGRRRCRRARRTSAKACWSIPRRRSTTTRARACRASFARKNTWARARLLSCAGMKMRRVSGSESRVKAGS